MEHELGKELKTDKILYQLRRYTTAFKSIFLYNTAIGLLGGIFMLLSAIVGSMTIFNFTSGLLVYSVLLEIVMYIMMKSVKWGL